MFSRMREIKGNQDGQALVLGALVMLILVAFLATSVDVGKFVNWRIKTQTAADAAAISGAKCEAALLNYITIANYMIIVGWAIRIIGEILMAAVVTYKIGKPMCKAGVTMTVIFGGIQDGLYYACMALVPYRVYRIATKNGADYGVGVDENGPVVTLKVTLPKKRLKFPALCGGKAWWLLHRAIERKPPEHLGVVTRKKMELDDLTRRLLKVKDENLNAFAQATTTPEDGGTLFWPNFDAKLEPIGDDETEEIENMLIVFGVIYQPDKIMAIKTFKPQH